ncbi:MAG: hypothetical protein P9X24_02035 [Candidatus Hatepunaea meridiana]|nr:hypothetical protein [Candidatus Hatepunaea meridiana]
MRYKITIIVLLAVLPIFLITSSVELVNRNPVIVDVSPTLLKDNPVHQRSLRRLPGYDMREGFRFNRNEFPRRDDPEIISYEDDDNLEYYFDMPNEWNDDSYFVRFTPDEAPFELIGLQVLLYDMGGNAGEPGMQVMLTQSTEDGYPGDEIETFDIPADDLVLSSFDDFEWNEILFDDYDMDAILFDRALDFHIILNVIQGDDGDILAIFSDDGRRQATDRSGFRFEGDFWVIMEEVEGIEIGVNLAIRAIVDYDPPDGPEIDVESEEFNFGEIEVSNVTSERLRINNIGDETLTIEQIAADNDAFYVGAYLQEDQYFEFSRTNDWHSFVIAGAVLNEQELNEYDEVGVLTPDGLCAGACGGWDRSGVPNMLKAYLDNPDTDEIEGFRNGEELTFRFYNTLYNLEVETEPTYSSGPSEFQSGCVTVLSLNGETEEPELTVEPDESLLLRMYFAPEEDEEYEGLLTIHSDALDNEELTIELRGIGQGDNRPPELRNHIEDVEIDEDCGEHLIASLDEVFFDPNDDELSFEIFDAFDGLDPDELNPTIDEESHNLMITPEEDFNGERVMIITARDQEATRNVYDYCRITIIPMNDPPQTGFNLLSPEDNYRVNRETNEVTFRWEEALDVENDAISYSVGFQILYEDMDINITGRDIEDTEFRLEHLDDFLYTNDVFSYEEGVDTEIIWWVEASDGEYTIESIERWVLIVPVPVSAPDDNERLPSEYHLSNIYPNPFNPSTQISFTIPVQTSVKLSVLDASGRLVDMLEPGQLPAGRHSISWIARENLANGIYVFVLDMDGFRIATKGVLIR